MKQSMQVFGGCLAEIRQMQVFTPSFCFAPGLDNCLITSKPAQLLAHCSSCP